MITLNRNRTHGLIRVASIGLLITAGAATIAACAGGGSTPHVTKVIVPDRTGSTSSISTWPQEVAATTDTIVNDAYKAGVDRIVLQSLGANYGDSAAVADVNLRTKCNNAKSCADDHDALATQIAEAAGQLAGTPLGHGGTDIIAAITTAKSVCGHDPCRIDVLTDAEDYRIQNNTPVKTLIDRYAAEVPDLHGVVIRLIGLGVDGSSTEHADRAKAFFEGLLTRAGAQHVVIARSI